MGLGLKVLAAIAKALEARERGLGDSPFGVGGLGGGEGKIGVEFSWFQEGSMAKKISKKLIGG